MINIRERPAEADDRVVPGHWEGGRSLGAKQRSQIGTLLALSEGRGTDLRAHPQADFDAVADELNTRPRRALSWRIPAEMYALEAGYALTTLDRLINYRSAGWSGS